MLFINMPNMRVSELVQITVPEMVAGDLLLISDITANQSKKLAISDLGTFLIENGLLTGSFNGTASYASYAATASYVPRGSSSYAPTSSWALNVNTASYALTAKSSSNAVTSSYVVTASYALNAAGQTVFSASFANNAKTASFLFYTPGVTNGTASYALTSSYISNLYPDIVDTSGSMISIGVPVQVGPNIRISSSPVGSMTISNPFNSSSIELTFDSNLTASIYGLIPPGYGGYTPLSVVGNPLLLNPFASYNVGSNVGINSGVNPVVNQLDVNGNISCSIITASLFYGTASYASTTGLVVGASFDYGVFTAITQSISSSQLDQVTINPSFGGAQRTTFEVLGTIDIPFTSSNGSTNGNIQLFVLDRQNGGSQSLDLSPIYVNLGGSSAISGTLKYPFSLIGNNLLNGVYEVYVTASNGIFIDPARPVKFKVTSLSDVLTVQPCSPAVFTTTPNNSIVNYSSSFHPGTLYAGSASQVIFSGSSDPTILYVPPTSGITSLAYTWTLTSLTSLIAPNNSGLTFVGGTPNSLLTMSVANCSITAIPHLGTSSLSVLDCSGNSIGGFFELAPTMSYVNVSNNFYMNSLPYSLPYGLISLLATNLNIFSTPISMSNTIQTMSFANCSNLYTWTSAPLPTALSYFDIHNTKISILPTPLPSNISYFDVSYCQIPSSIIATIAYDLVNNGTLNGNLKIINNPASQSATNITANLAILRSRGWSITS